MCSTDFHPVLTDRAPLAPVTWPRAGAPTLAVAALAVAFTLAATAPGGAAADARSASGVPTPASVVAALNPTAPPAAVAPVAPTAPTAPVIPALDPPTGSAPARTYLNELALIKSEFDDSLTTGKDPFFPRSSRIRGQAAVTNVPVVLDFPDLRLKGISGTATQRLALINRYTLAEGESQEIRVNDRSYAITCVAVRERSVVLSWRGQQRELFLRPGL